jgi:outer membrane protein OmpA-like peptidoglycan-associated protein
MCSKKLMVGNYSDAQPKKSVAVAEVPLTSLASVVETPAKAVPSSVFDTVYFDYDKADFKAEFETVVVKVKKNIEFSKKPVVVAGHCDARGSDVYNNALGMRRAEAIKKALVALKVPENMVETISYGKQCLILKNCQNDKCHAVNRRGVISIKPQGE